MFGRHSYVLTAKGSFAMISDHNALIADHDIPNCRRETEGCACMTELIPPKAQPGDRAGTAGQSGGWPPPFVSCT